MAWNIYLPSPIWGFVSIVCAGEEGSSSFMSLCFSLAFIVKSPRFSGHRVAWLVWTVWQAVLLGSWASDDQKHILSPRLQAHRGCWGVRTIRTSSLTAVVFSASRAERMPVQPAALPVSPHLAHRLPVRFPRKISHSL